MSALKLELMFPDKKIVKYMKQITSTHIFQDQGKGIEENGLYSQEIFGVVGTSERATTFAYIDLGVEMLHPRLYDYITQLSAFYNNIMASKVYAIWDEKIKDFVVSDLIDGETGYDFFMSHLHEVVFKETESVQRADKIAVLYKYIKEGRLTSNYLFVLPAGLRDFSASKDGRVKEDEVNDYYKTIINTANLLSNFKDVGGASALKFKLQVKLHDLYKHLLNLLDGKKKLIQGEWASPAVEYRTRTVAIGTEDIIKDLSVDENLLDISKAGLLLYIKSIDPLAKHLLVETFIKFVFQTEGELAHLVNAETLEPETVKVSSKIMDQWLTNDGLDNIMNALLDNDTKNEPVKLGELYLHTLVDMGNVIKKYDNLADIPDEEKKYRRPITYGELFYLSVLPKILKLPGFITRYPATGQGSIVPTLVDVLTTSKTRVVEYTRIGLSEYTHTINVYPILGESWINGIKAPYPRTEALGLDFDGDDLSLLMAMSENSIKEIMELLNTKSAYVSPDGKSILSAGDQVSSNVFKFMTRG